MDLVYLTLGILAVVLTVTDILKTTLSSNGGGMITNAVGRSIWNLFFLASRHNARAHILNYTGVSALVAVLVAWVCGLWLGLFFMLMGDPNSIVSSSRELYAGPLEKFYYAGFSLSTLGVGDYKASSNVWRVVTSVSAFAGLVLITTSVTYFLQVLSAVSLQSKISLYVHSMGSTPQAVLQNNWNGKDLNSFADASDELISMLIQHTLHHHSFPVLHYFHNTDPALSFKRSIVQFAEAYLLLRHAVNGELVVDQAKLLRIGNVLDAYIATVQDGYVGQSNIGKLPLPDLKSLQEHGLPVFDIAKVKEAFIVKEFQKREMLKALLMQDGWTWKDVYGEALVEVD